MVSCWEGELQLCQTEGVDFKEMVFVRKQEGRRGSGGRWSCPRQASSGVYLSPKGTQEPRAQPGPAHPPVAPPLHTPTLGMVPGPQPGAASGRTAPRSRPNAPGEDQVEDPQACSDGRVSSPSPDEAGVIPRPGTLPVLGTLPEALRHGRSCVSSLPSTAHGTRGCLVLRQPHGAVTPASADDQPPSSPAPWPRSGSHTFEGLGPPARAWR